MCTAFYVLVLCAGECKIILDNVICPIVLNATQKAYGGGMDLSRAWLKDPDRALAALQLLSPEVHPCRKTPLHSLGILDIHFKRRHCDHQLYSPPHPDFGSLKDHKYYSFQTEDIF